MAKLAGDAHVYDHDGAVYAPGDTLPKHLKHLSDEPDADTADASASGGTGDLDQDAKVEDMTVDQLRKELGDGNYAAGDRKDALVQLVLAKRASSDS